MSRPLLIDLFCCAGGAAMGYHQAGFDVIGVDHSPQPRYPFEFVLCNALIFLRNLSSTRVVSAVHASPPCQRYSINTRQHNTMDNHPDYIARVRHGLIETGLPYIIENVPGAPLINPVLLCGSMFGSTRLRRHRLFESNVRLSPPSSCHHSIQSNCVSVTGHAGGTSKRDGAERFGGTELWKEIMGIDWMVGRELIEAIPPIYTLHLGSQLIEQIQISSAEGFNHASSNEARPIHS